MIFLLELHYLGNQKLAEVLQKRNFSAFSPELKGCLNKANKLVIFGLIAVIICPWWPMATVDKTPVHA